MQGDCLLHVNKRPMLSRAISSCPAYDIHVLAMVTRDTYNIQCARQQTVMLKLC